MTPHNMVRFLLFSRLIFLSTHEVKDVHEIGLEFVEGY
jgi:hypothetical protein